MAFQQDDGFYTTDYAEPAPYSYDQNQFAEFDYGAAGGYYDPLQQQQQHQSAYTGQIMTPQANTYPTAGYEDEPPLLEELGINYDHIVKKTLAVLNPLKQPDASITHDTDLAGPLVFCLAFGACLLLMGKMHFGYIYGIAGIGCFCIYCLMNLMSTNGIFAFGVASILGYCMLPMVLLALGAILVPMSGVVGLAISTITVFWCSISASNLFVAALTLENQQLLVAYPCGILYSLFALMAVF